TTTLHALLQIVTVARGSPLGREVAPRDRGARGAGMVARKLRLREDEPRTLIACGAGAGLAAVSHVPLAGAVFSREV
ncbi:chloride channel protein, partial [Klebsiella pneumoniae]|uniref:chloride channel protein n=1 Tax=Klebsiella pneumoniae TaxID=573 RepID=UPI00272F8CDF